MEFKQGFERVVRWFGFLFIFVITNYVCVMLLQQAGEPPFFRSYETTAAVVMRTYVEESRFATADGYEGTRWCPRIEFQYAVNGQLFISDRYQPIVHCKSQQSAERLIAHFPPGHRIQVWYSTDDPGYAVIDKSIQPLVFLYYGGILFAWLIGNLFAVVSLKKNGNTSGRD